MADDDTQDVLASDTFDIDDAVVLDAVDGARSDAPNDVIEPEWHHHHHDNPQGSSTCDVHTYIAGQLVGLFEFPPSCVVANQPREL